ncbi:hypothetical protein [Metabacillus sp. RGM 3146]|uniref:hypothetical protein n=1 Tax=Metabacillus sp. RGM 3146 TaxID=3401092 RepID=UPI003B9B1859
MAFGISREELNSWKKKAEKGEVALLTHFWLDDRFPDSHAVTKAGCSDLSELIQWGKKHGLKPEWIDRRSSYPHFDLMGEKQLEILKLYGLSDHIKRFNL